MTAASIACPLRAAYQRAKIALACWADDDGDMTPDDLARPLRQLVEAFEASDHALLGLVEAAPGAPDNQGETTCLFHPV